MEPGEVVRTAAGRVGKPPGSGAGTPSSAKKFKDNYNWEKKKVKAAKYSPSGPMLKSPSEKYKHSSSSGKLPLKFNFPGFGSRSPSSGPPVKQVAKKGTGGTGGPGILGALGTGGVGVAKKSTAKKFKAAPRADSLSSSDLKRCS